MPSVSARSRQACREGLLSSGSLLSREGPLLERRTHDSSLFRMDFLSRRASFERDLSKEGLLSPQQGEGLLAGSFFVGRDSPFRGILGRLPIQRWPPVQMTSYMERASGSE